MEIYWRSDIRLKRLAPETHMNQVGDFHLKLLVKRKSEVYSAICSGVGVAGLNNAHTSLEFCKD